MSSLLFVACLVAAEPFSFDLGKDSLDIRHQNGFRATYVFRDAEISRPYFANVIAPGGIPITRTHPPVEGVDATDHATFHPGIWLAFGDVNGADFWRNNANVRFVEFTQKPREENGKLSFVARYTLDGDDGPIATQESAYTFELLNDGVLLHAQYAFGPIGDEIIFGDQEEMGFGLRMATPLTVERGHGTITNGLARVNEKGVWGQQSSWCDYSAIIDGRRVGAMIIPERGNFRESWFHARDYGLLVANPFGKSAFQGGEKSAIRVGKGESLRLGFRLLIYTTGEDRTPRSIASDVLTPQR